MIKQRKFGLIWANGRPSLRKLLANKQDSPLLISFEWLQVSNDFNKALSGGRFLKEGGTGFEPAGKALLISASCPDAGRGFV